MEEFSHGVHFVHPKLIMLFHLRCKLGNKIRLCHRRRSIRLAIFDGGSIDTVNVVVDGKYDKLRGSARS
jgi:hypothetical protein